MEIIADSATPPTQERLADALYQFHQADAAFKGATQRLVAYQRSHTDFRAIIVGARFDTRVGAGSGEREALERAAAHALDRRNEALRAWAKLKTAAREGE
jgi:hypothetical protein